MSEADEQAAVIRWCELSHIPVFHIPNGGARDVRTGAMLKRQGVRRGVPDLCIPIARGGYHGLYVEMKTKTGKTTPEQETWLRRLDSEGYRAVVCHGFREAVDEIHDYAKGLICRK